MTRLDECLSWLMMSWNQGLNGQRSWLDRGLQSLMMRLRLMLRLDWLHIQRSCLNWCLYRLGNQLTWGLCRLRCWLYWRLYALIMMWGKSRNELQRFLLFLLARIYELKCLFNFVFVNLVMSLLLCMFMISEVKLRALFGRCNNRFSFF